MKKSLLLAGVISAASFANLASATTVNEFESSYTANYVWYEKDVRDAGTASIEDLTGKGGNLENNAPLPTGAAKLTTGPSNNNDKAEVGISGNFGTVQSFLNGGTLSYDYYKSSTDVNQAAAAAIKLEILDGNTSEADGYTTFVFEPYWNIVPGVSTNPPTDTWTNIDITGTSGTFWHTGLYGDGNQAGNGSDANTLTDWVTHFGVDLLDATIIGISVGVGTYNNGQIAYFDDVTYNNGQQALAYDFEVSVVPLPAALPLYGAGLGLLGLMGWRRRKQNSAAV